MEEHNGRRRPRLVLIATPLQGHMTPMLQLGTYLHSQGFSITVAHAEFNRPDPSNHPHFNFLSLPDHLSGPKEFASFIHFLEALNKNCRPHLKEHLIKIIDTETDKESIVIVHDNIMLFAGSVARDLSLPSIILCSSSAASFPATDIIPRLHQEGRFPVQDSLSQEIVPELHHFRYKDLPSFGLTMQEALHTISVVIPKTTPSAFIWNTLEFLEPAALTQIRDHYQVPIFTIGPLHKIIPTPSTSYLEEDVSCISWLDKQAPKSVIYVSLGSLANVDEKVSTEMVWGLANSKQPFIWVVRPGSVYGFEWIEFLEEGLLTELKGRGLIVKWAPQKDILAHFAVGGFWSHCGWNSTLEGVSEGVPLLCQPLHIDQRLNARYISIVWKMGVELVVERREIECTVKRVLVCKEGEEMRKRGMEIQEKVQTAVSHGGSLQNSLKDLLDFILSL